MRIALIIDVGNWAWAHKARALKKYLSADFEHIEIIRSKKVKNRPKIFKKFNHIHYFGWMEGALWAKKYRGLTAGVSSFNYYYRHLEEAKLYMKRYKALTCTSQLIFDALKKRGYQKNLYYCPNGVDETVFTPKKKERGKFIIGWSGQPTQGNFSRTDRRIDMHGYESVLLPLMESLKDHNDVEFRVMANTYKSAIPFGKMPEYYQGLDLFVHTGFGIGTPNPLFESNSCGVAGISVAIGAAPELVQNGYNGYLIPRYFNKPEALNRAEAIKEKILFLKDNRDLCDSMGEKARNVIEADWTWKERAQNWKTVFLNHKRKL